ncbi:esterase/lipase family protein [Alkaliphilus pronyensis]|nr:alpha/beta fold hydrolase [Alkaliphilus pronyensis]
MGSEDMTLTNTPIIFVPGLFGSMSNEIIPGTGDWSFGIAKVAYGQFIEMLELMGFKLNKDLFISFYDWRKNCSDSARNYLYKTIQRVKAKTHSKKVNIICHSMGGLVTRAYVQSNYYNDDVNKMIVMATPNTGSPPNFSYWTGGKLPSDTGKEFDMVRAYMTGYLAILSEIFRNDPIEGIHEEFPGLNDIIPSKQYGDYLFTKEGVDITQYKLQCHMSTQNTFLNELNENINIIKQRNIDVTVIAGIGEETVEALQIIPSLSNEKWVDGKVIDLKKTINGDGNATLRSVFFLDGDKYTVNGTHIEMLYKSEPILIKKLK